MYICGLIPLLKPNQSTTTHKNKQLTLISKLDNVLGLYNGRFQSNIRGESTEEGFPNVDENHCGDSEHQELLKSPHREEHIEVRL